MLQTILMSKAFQIAKKYWQVLAGFFTFLFLYIIKERHDSKIKKETTTAIETQARIETAKQQQVLNDASESALISHAAHPLPDSWDSLKQLSKSKKTGNPGKNAKAAKDKILKRVRPKN